jgi:hypothetical protein
MAWLLTTELMARNKVLNAKCKRSKSFPIGVKAWRCSIFSTPQHYEWVFTLVERCIGLGSKWWINNFQKRNIKQSIWRLHSCIVGYFSFGFGGEVGQIMAWVWTMQFTPHNKMLNLNNLKCFHWFYYYI